MKLTRKKDTVLADAQWQLDIDENLLPDERILLERDFSIEIPRQLTPPAQVQSSVRSFSPLKYRNERYFVLKDNLPPLPWEVSKPTHGKRITLLPDIEVKQNFDISKTIPKRLFFQGTSTEIRFNR